MNIKIEEGKNYLVTTDGWFVAPDGEQYRSVWGTCAICTTEEILGFTPTRPSTNWFLKIGEMFVAGCHIHYLIQCPEEPCLFENLYIDPETKIKVGRIYFANSEN